MMTSRTRREALTRGIKVHSEEERSFAMNVDLATDAEGGDMGTLSSQSESWNKRQLELPQSPLLQSKEGR